MAPTARTLIASAHPGPTIVVTAVSMGLAISVGARPVTVALITATILANQLSIGWSNDAIDAHRDRDAGRSDKPVARGEIGERSLLGAAVAAALIAVALSAALGAGAAIAHALLLGSGWAYNLGVKRTLAATACYAVGFGALPSIITLAVDTPAPAALWATLAGALLGVAAHFTNVVPDAADDIRHDMRALPHRLSPRVSVAIALGALLSASALGYLGALSAGPIGALSIAGSILAVTCVIAGTVLLVRRPTSRALFRIVMAAAISAVLMLLGAGTLSA
jgi:4-hydroxybenzoate polyprenyltransferase